MMMSRGLISQSLPCQANRVQMVSSCQQRNYQQVVQRRALPQKVSEGVLVIECMWYFLMTVLLQSKDMDLT